MTKNSFDTYMHRIREYKRRIEFYANEIEGITKALELDMEWTESEPNRGPNGNN